MRRWPARFSSEVDRGRSMSLKCGIEKVVDSRDLPFRRAWKIAQVGVDPANNEIIADAMERRSERRRDHGRQGSTRPGDVTVFDRGCSPEPREDGGGTRGRARPRQEGVVDRLESTRVKTPAVSQFDGRRQSRSAHASPQLRRWTGAIRNSNCPGDLGQGEYHRGQTTRRSPDGKAARRHRRPHSEISAAVEHITAKLAVRWRRTETDADEGAFSLPGRDDCTHPPAVEDGIVPRRRAASGQVDED